MATDYWTTYRWIDLLKDKTDKTVMNTIESLLSIVRQTIPNVRILYITIRADKAFEHMAKRTEMLGAKVHWEFCAPYYHEQNARAEISNQIITNRMWTMMCGCTLPTELWGEAARYAVEVTNRLPTKANQDMQSPYEMVFNKKVYKQNFDA